MSALASEHLNSGLGWRLFDGRLRADDPKAQALLLANCRATAIDGKRRCMATSPQWGSIVAIDIVLAPENLALTSARLLLIRMRTRSLFAAPDVDQLVSVFDITQAEAAVLASLCAGHSVDEIAGLRQSSVQTVRSQVASLMRKMGCNRQSELVRLGALL